jgi:hypothetical protein
LRGLQDVKAAVDTVRKAMVREVDAIAANDANGRPNKPEVRYSDVQVSSAPAEAVEAIRRTGTAIVRGVFLRAQAESVERP